MAILGDHKRDDIIGGYIIGDYIPGMMSGDYLRGGLGVIMRKWKRRWKLLLRD